MSAFWAGMALHLWQTSLLLALLLLLDRLVRSGPARFRERLWGVALLKLLVPLALIDAWWPDALRFGGGAADGPVMGPALVTLGRIAHPDLIGLAPEAPESAAPRVGLILLTVLWAAGVTALMGLWWWSTRRSLSPMIEPWRGAPAALQKLERALAGTPLGLARLRVTESAVMPCLRRLLRPQVVLPRAVIDELSVEELRAILLHEEAHRARGDLWRSALQGLAARAFFFYPPIWWVVRRLRHSAEMACDEAVLGAGVSPRVYETALAKSVRLGLRPVAAGALSVGAASGLQERLARLRNHGRNPVMMRHRLVVVLAVVTAVALSLVPLADAGGLAGAAVAATSELPVPVAAPSAAAGDPIEGSAVPPEGPAAGSAASGQGITTSPLRLLTGSSRRVTLRYHDTDIRTVITRLASEAGFAVAMDSLDPRIPITIIVTDTPVYEVLELLQEDNDIVFEVPDSATLNVSFTTRPRRAVVVRPYRPGGVSGESGGPMRVGGDIKQPERIVNVAPEYPELARRARLEGPVILQATIDRQGNVTDAEVLRGLGMGLDEAARDAVLQWKYTPTYYNGAPVEVILTVTVTFRLIK